MCCENAKSAVTFLLPVRPKIRCSQSLPVEVNLAMVPLWESRKPLKVRKAQMTLQNYVDPFFAHSSLLSLKAVHLGINFLEKSARLYLLVETFKDPLLRR